MPTHPLHGRMASTHSPAESIISTAKMVPSLESLPSIEKPGALASTPSHVNPTPQAPPFERITAAPLNPTHEEFDTLISRMWAWEKAIIHYGQKNGGKGWTLMLHDGSEVHIPVFVGVNPPSCSLDLELESASVAVSIRRVKSLEPVR